MHEGPTPEKRTLLQNYLRSLGLGLSVSDDPAPAEFQHIALSTRDRPDAAQIHMMLLRSMQQAIYTPENNGHFGLAYEAYTHFTSPIRRYPDSAGAPRAQGHPESGKHYTVQAPMPMNTPNVRPGAAARKATPKKASVGEVLVWEGVGLHCSANERRADEASRDVEAWLKCKYMREHLGEEYAGTVSAVTSFGLFITLDELYVEGLVHITELGGEYFRFDEARQELRGERTGVRYATGSRLRIQVSRVDLDGRKIDFRLVRDDEGRHGLRPEPKLAPGAAETARSSDALKAMRQADREAKALGKRAASGRQARRVRARLPGRKGAEQATLTQSWRGAVPSQSDPTPADPMTPSARCPPPCVCCPSSRR